jgi:hypothetical protein
MSPARAIRTASVLSYVVGLGTLLTLGPSLASDLLTDRSTGSPLGLNPSYGNFTGPNPLGLPVVVVVIFGVAFLVAAALEVVAGLWLWKSQRRGGWLGVILAVAMTGLSIGLILVAWLPIGAVLIALIGAGWKTLR